MSTGWIDYVGVAVFGALVGLAELVSRYRDEPVRAVNNWPSYIYVAINSLISMGALTLIQANWWQGPPKEAPGSSTRLMQVLLAGFGAMAFLRTSIFTLRIANQDIGIGPSAVVQALLRAVDSAVDRLRALDRDQAVTTTMAQVSFEKAYQLLPAHCLALMQNLPQEDQVALGRQVEAISRMNISDSMKARLLGLALLNVVGEEVLFTAVSSLIAEIQR
jgi:hypothetical protein